MTLNVREEVVVREGTLADVPAVTELTNICTAHAVGGGALTVEELTSQWSREMFQPERDTQLVFAPDGTLAAAGEFWSRSPHVYPYFWGAVHPAHRGSGYGTTLMDWADRRIQHNLALAPADARVAIRVSAHSHETESLALFERCGYVAARHFLRMRIDMQPGDVPEAQWAAGIRVRNHVPGQDDRAVYEAVEAGFQDHWGYMPTAFDHFRESMIDTPTFDSALWFLAVADTPQGEQIAGLSLGRMGTDDDPELGYVMDVCVLREYRRQGVALALLHHTFAAFQARGVMSVTLGVDATSLTGATRLYEKAGMYAERQSAMYEKVWREGEELSIQTLE